VATARVWRELVGKWNHNPRLVTRRDSRAQGDGEFPAGVPPSWNEGARDQTPKLPVLRYGTLPTFWSDQSRTWIILATGRCVVDTNATP